jgi:superfamily II RNA helicase
MSIKKFQDFDSKKDIDKLKTIKRSFQPNSDRQNFTTNTRNEFDPITRKITQYTEGEIDDKLDNIEEKKSEKFEDLKDCPSFNEFNKSISELKKLTKKIQKELKRGTKSEIDDYIEKRIFGRDV